MQNSFDGSVCLSNGHSMVIDVHHFDGTFRDLHKLVRMDLTVLSLNRKVQIVICLDDFRLLPQTVVVDLLVSCLCLV